ncbi:hypothetical protein [Chitinophaga sp. Cy-1792]|uniref:hypothetical protein n=1 Tax=Chitinophaga sp. Cy-1792 TaxID=2608339 RepID=UPI001422D7B6|nr:hypothetical protein [Chitinophaga sp. Cy-1792]NIG54510.1 hypothetical protein [Chitinophaga sp. Cy-1792]
MLSGQFIKIPGGTKKELEYEEINQLKKDILWIFDENGADLHHAFVPGHSFTIPYWQYMTLHKDVDWVDEEVKFSIAGAMIVTLCMVVEYIDIVGGDQSIFSTTPLAEVLDYTRNFEPADENLHFLKNLLIAGLTIATGITKEDLWKNEPLEGLEIDAFYEKLRQVRERFILPYYQSKLT